MRRTIAFSLVALTLLSACHRRAQRHVTGAKQSIAKAPSAPVVVTIVVDQLAAWVASERLPLLPTTGGFARLLREGSYVREARHGHASTDTAPGHASLYTGTSARDSGIFGNDLIDETTRRRVSILRDERVKLVTEKGVSATPGSSIAYLRTEPLADRLKAEKPNAIVMSFSLKDRGAIFAGGTHPDVSIWFEPNEDSFVTSTAFAQKLPDFVLREGGTAAVQRSRATWEPLDPAWVSAHAATKDDQVGEGNWSGFGTVFPHDFAKAERPSTVFRGSPAGDERLFAIARAALDDPRLGTVPTLLAISLSSNDYVSHVFGPDSWEAWDELYRLDRGLGAFLTALDARFGSDGWSLLLSADHGVTKLPETQSNEAARPFCAKDAPHDRWDRFCDVGGRILLEEVTREMHDEAVRVMGKRAETWVLGTADPYVYLSAEAKSLPAAEHDKLVATLLAKLTSDPRVARAVDTRVVAEHCAKEGDESLDAVLCRAIPKNIPGDIYVMPKPGFFFDADYVPGKGTSHGTPYLYDRTVPLLVRAPGRAAGGAIEETPISTAAFSRTAAALLGIGAPSDAAEGRVLVR